MLAEFLKSNVNFPKIPRMAPRFSIKTRWKFFELLRNSLNFSDLPLNSWIWSVFLGSFRTFSKTTCIYQNSSDFRGWDLNFSEIHWTSGKFLKLPEILWTFRKFSELFESSMNMSEDFWMLAGFPELLGNALNFLEITLRKFPGFHKNTGNVSEVLRTFQVRFLSFL